MAFLPLLSICFPCNGNWYNQAKERSTTHLFGSTAKECNSVRFNV
ncbi:hypothetical protein [Wolbachia endosymbiont (group B) of Eucosma cana]|nr:hypothetical protein [Wolbachia endosymbiont (group B) of Eucosma cana]